MRGRFTPLLLLVLLLGLSACAGDGGQMDVGMRAPMDCVPFARNLSGVRLAGDAYTWWSGANGRYARSHRPQIGSVLVFERSGRLPVGHVAVVSSIGSRREITVTQANWVHGRMTQDQPVVDVSPYNDWTEVRVWWPPTGTLGSTVYRTYGFILNDRPMTHALIAASAPRAVSGWVPEE
jgi:hypothetical protein